MMGYKYQRGVMIKREKKLFCFQTIVQSKLIGIQFKIVKFKSAIINIKFWKFSQSVLLVEETEGPGENHRPVPSHW
jgi:hypothetical protein